MKVKHTLIEQLPNGFVLPGDNTLFPNIQDIIKFYANALVNPLRKKHIQFTFPELKEGSILIKENLLMKKL